ncbi:hypothetical protein AB0392_07250 [Nonomuraea angiospora]|uniref:hypothetical protein n=1 Tax=Nonomuraea angiospora TaxID=46172 RepID=UPI00344BAE3F
MLVPSSASRARTCRWLMASRPVVGSSATSRSGSPARASDGHLLALPAGQLVRIWPEHHRLEPRTVEQVGGPGRAAVQGEHLGELGADAVHGAEPGHRALWHGGDAGAAHTCPVGPSDEFVLAQQGRTAGPRRGGEQAEQGAGQRGRAP